MDELVRAFNRFIARDLVFLLGGALVLVSILYASDRLCIADLSVPGYFVSFGLAYVLGYAIQDLSALTPFVTVADHFEPNRFVRWLYRRLTRQAWQRVQAFDPYDLHLVMRAQAPPAVALLERVISLRQVGNTIGPSALIAAAPLVLHALGTVSPSSRCLDIFLAVTLVVVGFGLICLGWVKGAQQMRYMHALEQLAQHRGGDA